MANMETKTLASAVSGTGNSSVYFIENDRIDNKVQVFITMTSGTVTLQASADGTNFAPIPDGQVTGSSVLMLDLAEGTYLRAAYATAVGLTVIVKPCRQENWDAA